MQKYPGWERCIINLKFTNNKMICIRHLADDWVYFSRNEYKTIKNALLESEKYMVSKDFIPKTKLMRS